MSIAETIYVLTYNALNPEDTTVEAVSDSIPKLQAYATLQNGNDELNWVDGEGSSIEAFVEVEDDFDENGQTDFYYRIEQIKKL